MQRYMAVLTPVLIVGMALIRIMILRRTGTQAMHFGRIDRTDFLIPPFALFYLYVVFAAAFGLPAVSTSMLFRSGAVAWVGVALCFAAVALYGLSLIDFGRSFRVGIDIDRPDALVTRGVFARSRNPIYVALGCVLLGEFLVFPNWIPLLYLLAGSWLIHRQVLREEDFLRRHYSRDYENYTRRVRRYL